MKLTVSSALLLAVVAVGAASASASDAVAVDGDAAAHLRHRKLSGRKHGGHAAHKKTATKDANKLKTRNLKKNKNADDTKTVEDNENKGKNTVKKQKDDKTTGTGNGVDASSRADFSQGTSRTVAINRFGPADGKPSFPYNGKNLVSDSDCENLIEGKASIDCEFLGSGPGSVGVSRASFATYGCVEDDECQSGCCFAGYFGTLQDASGGAMRDATNNYVPGRCCVNANIFTGADPNNAKYVGCKTPLAADEAVLTGGNSTNGL